MADGCAWYPFQTSPSFCCPLCAQVPAQKHRWHQVRALCGEPALPRQQSHRPGAYPHLSFPPPAPLFCPAGPLQPAEMSVKARARAALLGSFVADAATMPLHWIYNNDEADTMMNEAGVAHAPEFFNPPANKYYQYALGALSPYGAPSHAWQQLEAAAGPRTSAGDQHPPRSASPGPRNSPPTAPRQAMRSLPH